MRRFRTQAKLQNLLATDVVALSFGEITDDELNKLGNYGANKVLSASGVNKGDSQQTSNLFAENLADASTVIIFANTYTAKMIAPRLASKTKSRNCI